MSADPFGRAILDHHRAERAAPLVQRDGEEILDHPIEDFYFGDHDEHQQKWTWADVYIDGPLLDVGAGAGREARFYQDRFEVVATDVSEHLVTTMRERGVEDARVADMFALPDSFQTDRFDSVLSHGTQLGLAGSMVGLRRFLEDLDTVTTPSGSVVLDSYDPGTNGIEDLLGYRSDPTPGLGFRVMSFEYEETQGDILLFRLFGPDRLREAAAETGWTVDDICRPDESDRYYLAALEKR
jgi:SAM-dependent methyltransferase